jgi:hypothetical protein
VTLFRDPADHFREKVRFPPDITGGIADEQFVRNVVDFLCRTRSRESS